MAVRDDFAPGEVLASADLNDTFASKLDLAGGKVLQVVRSTTTTRFETTNTAFTDVTGASVTITPQKSDSAIIVLWQGLAAPFVIGTTTTDLRFETAITDASNNGLGGANNLQVGSNQQGSGAEYHTAVMVGYSTPATTSATTYKVRSRVINANATGRWLNDVNTGQMYAIEVSA